MHFPSPTFYCFVVLVELLCAGEAGSETLHCHQLRERQCGMIKVAKLMGKSSPEAQVSVKTRQERKNDNNRQLYGNDFLLYLCVYPTLILKQFRFANRLWSPPAHPHLSPGLFHHRPKELQEARLKPRGCTSCFMYLHGNT